MYNYYLSQPPLPDTIKELYYNTAALSRKNQEKTWIFPVFSLNVLCNFLFNDLFNDLYNILSNALCKVYCTVSLDLIFSIYCIFPFSIFLLSIYPDFP